MTNKRQFAGERVRLGEVCAVNPRQPRFLNDGDEVTFIPLAAVNTDGTMNNGTSAVRSEVRKGHPWFRKGDILLAKITPSFENGKIAIADCSSDDGYASTEFHVIRLNLDVIDGRYLLSYLRTAKVRQYCAARMKGSAGQRRVPIGVLKALPVPVASMVTQKYIADVLSRVNLAIGTRRNVLFQLDTLVKSRFVEMFGDPVDNPKGLTVKPIGDIADVQTGATPLRTNSAYYGGSIPWVKTGEVAAGLFERAEETITKLALRETNCKLFPAGTVLVAMYGQGDTRGKAAILREPAATNQACAAILPYDECDASFLLAQLRLRYEDLRARSLGGNQKNLSLKIIKSYEVVVPPIELQKRFLDFVAKVDKPRFVEGCSSAFPLPPSAKGLCSAYANW